MGVIRVSGLDAVSCQNVDEAHSESQELTGFDALQRSDALVEVLDGFLVIAVNIAAVTLVLQIGRGGYRERVAGDFAFFGAEGIDLIDLGLEVSGAGHLVAEPASSASTWRSTQR